LAWLRNPSASYARPEAKPAYPLYHIVVVLTLILPVGEEVPLTNDLIKFYPTLQACQAALTTVFPGERARMLQTYKPQHYRIIGKCVEDDPINTGKRP
jgi:hypothetical protein